MAAIKWIVSLAFGIFGINAGNIYIKMLPLQIRTQIMKFLALSVFELVVFCGSYIIWQTVKSALQRTRSSISKTCKFFLAVYLFISNTSMLSVLFLKGTHPHWYSMFSFICFGIFAQLIFAVLTLKAVFLLLRGFAKLGLIKLHQRKTQGTASCTPDFIPSRIGRVSLLVIFIYSVSIGLYGVHRAWQPPSVAMVNITLPRFPPSLSGLKVLLLADIHLGEMAGRDEMNEIVDIAQGLKPDLVVLVGDLMDGRVDQLRAAAEPLKRLTPPRGKYFVTGNHEYISMDVENWFRYLATLGFTILHNSNVRIGSAHMPGEFFCLAGVDDWTAENFNRIMDTGHKMDVDKALKGCDDQHATVLLAHQPNAAKYALDTDHDIQLILSGHTHGGQFFPASMLIYLSNPFYAGLYEYKDSLVYVSQGAVYWGIPMRIGSQGEIDLITLYS